MNSKAKYSKHSTSAGKSLSVFSPHILLFHGYIPPTVFIWAVI